MMTQAVSAKTTISLRKLFVNITFLLTLFPYLTILKVSWDTQPWALLVAFIYIIFMLLTLNFRVSIPTPLFIIILVTVYGICLSLIYAIFAQVDTSIMLRRLAGYATVIALAFVAIKEHRNVWSGWLVIAILAWLMTALAQKFFGFDFVNLLLPRVSTGIQRGVVSLAPEPSYYAIQNGFFMILNEIFWREHRYARSMYLLLLCLCIFQLLLSLSGTGFVLLMAFVVGKILSIQILKWKILGLICLTVITLIFIIAPFELPNNVRIGIITNTMKYVLIGKESFRTLLADRSIAYRLVNPVLGLYGGLVVSKGIGFGWGRITEARFPQWLVALLGPYRYAGGVPIGEWKWGGTIMGGLIAAIYEMGLMGLLCVGVILVAIFRAWLMKKINNAILFLSLILIFGGFVSLAHPLFGYLIGLYFMYHDSKKKWE